MKLKKSYTFLFSLITFCFFAQENNPKKFATRVVAGPILSFYSNNSLHTTNTKPRPAFFVGVYEDIRIYHDFSFLPGIEYVNHGVTFDTYFLAPGFQTLYNKQFDYNYILKMQEARLNLLCRQIIGIETRNLITGYVEYGYVIRYLFNSELNVNSNLTGAEVYSGKTNYSFEHPFFSNSMASAFKLTGGMQHNFFKSHRAWFFECSYMYSLSRVLITNSFAPNSLYINSSFLQLGLGVKF